MTTALILGARSGMAMAVSELLAERKVNQIWAARNSSTLLARQKELTEKFSVKIEITDFDVLDFGSHQNFAERYASETDAVLCFIGYLPDQTKAQENPSEEQKTLVTNFTSLVSILNIFAEKFEKKKQGWIVGVSSVAGERVRSHNLFYGTAKKKFTQYLEELNFRMKKSNVNVLIVKPGYFSTSMTVNLNLPKLLVRQPHVAAKDILSAVDNGQDVIFTPWFWKYIVSVVKMLPEFLLKRINR